MRSRVRLADLEPERVGLIKPSSLGDVIHALPVLSALRRRWPAAHVTWVVNRGLRGLLDGHPELDDVLPFDRSAARVNLSGLTSLGQFARQLRAQRFDLVIDLQGLLRSALMSVASGAPVRVGLAEAREGAHRFYTHRVETTGGSLHMVDRMLQVAAAFGADVSQPRFRLPEDDASRSWAAELLVDLPRPRVAFNLGTRWLTKRWPADHFAELARRAQRSFGAGLLVLGAPEDRPLVDEFQAALGPIPHLDLCGRSNLQQLLALAAATDVFVSNDTGPLHLAAAAGTRTVSVYTCSDPRRTGPYDRDAAVVVTTVWCASSCVKTCDRMDCMRELGPDRVWPALLRQLERSMTDRSSAA